MTMLSASPAWHQDRDGKRVYLKGGQAWAKTAPRDEGGHFIGRKRLDPVVEAARQRRRERDAAVKAQLADQRTRVGRRVRAIENNLRAQLRKQGRAVSIDADITIGQIAQATVRIEAFRAQLNRGLEVDDNQMSRLINISQRGLSKLGLRPTRLDGERAPRGHIAKARWAERETRKATQIADRGVPESNIEGPPRARAAPAE